MKKTWKRGLSLAMALTLVLGLINLTALATEEDGGKTLTCTLDEHTHSIANGCYALTCGTEESEGHTHNETCYGAAVLTCELDGVEGHEHSEGCYGEPPLACGLEESAGHSHSDGCYDMTTPICGKEAHTHVETCYAAAIPNPSNDSSEDQNQQTEAVINRIAALPAADAVSLADKADVEAARAAYDALSDEQKTAVVGIDKLLDAERKLAELETAPVSLAPVASIGDVTYTTLDQAVQAAKGAADAVTITVLTDCALPSLSIQGMNLTFEGAPGVNPTITFEQYGIHANESKLTFRGCTLSMTVSDNPGHSGAAANLIDDSDLILEQASMILTNDKLSARGEHGIFLYQASNLYLYSGSRVTISDFNDEPNFSGIYADWSEAHNIADHDIVIDGASSMAISSCGWHGMTVNPINVTVSDGSVLTLTENGGNGGYGGLGSYYGTLRVLNGSTVNASNNPGAGWGIFVKGLEVDGTSTLNACENGGVGLDLAGVGTIAGGAAVNLDRNAGEGLYIYPAKAPWAGDLTIDAGANVSIQHNGNSGIHNWNILVMNAGTVMFNNASHYGGGLINRKDATAMLSAAVNIYNNHAAIAGDDIYNYDGATVSFASTGSGWALGGAPDCAHAITGWFHDGRFTDAEGIAVTTRWNGETAQNGVCIEGRDAFYQEYAVTGAPFTGLLALKAAHGYLDDTPTTPPTTPPILPPDTPPTTPPTVPPTVPEEPPEQPGPSVEEIPEEQPPLAENPAPTPAPELPVEEIVEEEVPMAEAPKTGDSLALWAVLSALSGMGLLGLALTGRRRREEEG